SNLRGAGFVECDLSRADFTGALLAGATFTDCDLSGADFNGARAQDIP
ncbi:pentapeptide repeat-containing protein, partial [bacterium]